MEQKEIIKKLEKELEFIKREKNFWIKRIMDLNLETIYQGRNLIRDVVTISVAVVGFVIPLLLNSDVNFDRNLLLISGICFLGSVLYGILLLLFVIRKELKSWPKTSDEMMGNMNKDMLIIANTIRDPSVKNYEKAFDEIAERHKPKKEDEKWWNKFINHDAGFYGLFILALTLLMISIFKANFQNYDILDYFKK